MEELNYERYMEWLKKKATLPEEAWDQVKPKFQRVLKTILPGLGKLEKEKIMPAPITKDHPDWNAVASRLCSGTIRNVVFLDTEQGKVSWACIHATILAMGREMPPCYEQAVERGTDPAALERIKVSVSMKHGERMRALRRLRGNKCPAFVRSIALCNSDGWCVLVDLYALKGIPTPILNILSSANIHKVCFDLPCDLFPLKASVEDLPEKTIAWYDAKFAYETTKGHCQQEKVKPSWAPQGPHPHLGRVFQDYSENIAYESGKDPVLCDEKNGSLKDLLKVFTGHDLEKSKTTTGWGLDWFQEDELTQERVEYALADVVATAAVYLMSLMLRKDWLDDKNMTSSHCSDWVKIGLQTDQDLEDIKAVIRADAQARAAVAVTAAQTQGVQVQMQETVPSQQHLVYKDVARTRRIVMLQEQRLVEALPVLQALQDENEKLVVTINNMQEQSLLQVREQEKSVQTEQPDDFENLDRLEKAAAEYDSISDVVVENEWETEPQGPQLPQSTGEDRIVSWLNVLSLENLESANGNVDAHTTIMEQPEFLLRDDSREEGELQSGDEEDMYVETNAHGPPQQISVLVNQQFGGPGRENEDAASLDAWTGSETLKNRVYSVSKAQQTEGAFPFPPCPPPTPVGEFVKRHTKWTKVMRKMKRDAYWTSHADEAKEEFDHWEAVAFAETLEYGWSKGEAMLFRGKVREFLDKLKQMKFNSVQHQNAWQYEQDRNISRQLNRYGYVRYPHYGSSSQGVVLENGRWERRRRPQQQPQQQQQPRKQHQKKPYDR